MKLDSYKLYNDYSSEEIESIVSDLDEILSANEMEMDIVFKAIKDLKTERESYFEPQHRKQSRSQDQQCRQ